MSALINSLKSDLDALSSRQSQAAGLLSVNPSEDRRVEALNHVYAMVPLVRDMYARLEALEKEVTPTVAEVVEVSDGVRLSVPTDPQPAATVATAQSVPGYHAVIEAKGESTDPEFAKQFEPKAEPLSFNKPEPGGAP